jgi:hypothetical protein
MNIKYLIIHCTATVEGREVTAAEIRRWHTAPPPAGRSWKQVGYTDLFHLDGKVERLVKNNEDENVDSWDITNGAAGINADSRLIVYAGGLAEDGKTARDTRTPAQKEALKNYVLDFVKRFPNVKIAGHSQFAAKACPSFDVPKWCREIGVKEGQIYKK